MKRVPALRFLLAVSVLGFAICESPSSAQSPTPHPGASVDASAPAFPEALAPRLQNLGHQTLAIGKFVFQIGGCVGRTLLRKEEEAWSDI